ncbi:GPI ethanolamine phosphate transferase 2 isoform X2 [Ziziphus jujuba]|uniref:GPI ethanolamine phosphate transferase 2 isoform X2 n=1 Tax=Ziziphus jujuba TaxID=326968 RepID=A0A6P4AWP6_ZIZJJ|nr:GPI ethanolamine phosphate transferase 2 isoform X2 [Ziziphus jujuba]
MSSLTCTKLTLFTIAGVVIQMVGLSIFVFGFFPVKPALSGVSGPESYRSPTSPSNQNQSEKDLSSNQRRSLYQELSGIPPSFDRLILMVIDGLPAEFVLGKDGKPPCKTLMEAMPYTQSLLSTGMAVGYHAKAAPPTVTMPRLKAMVSGAIGGFLDVAFNFNTQALLDDNLLDQFFKIGWKMVMLGDETWLKLFPGLFLRHDGVSSFFVKDTVQVDQNVSRHLPNELIKHDWDLLILHYLGLDHVGHIGGRNSLLMAPKLKEMDDVVKMIHTSSILNQANNNGHTLLVVVSDHGMTENGNHGGSSYEETDSLALFIGLKSDVSDYLLSKDHTVFQVDIAPTLALLFGVPIPKNNVGVLISRTFWHLTDDQQLRALELNSWQLLRLLEAQLPGLSCGSSPYDGLIYEQGSRISKCNGSLEKVFCCLYMHAAFLHSSWMSKEVSRSTYREEYSAVVAAYHEFLRTASEWLSRRASDRPVNLLAFGIAAMLLSTLLLLGLIFFICKEVYVGEKQNPSDLKKTSWWHLDEAFCVGVILILVLSMGSSSMVEEEQYLWHFFSCTLNFLFMRKAIQSVQGGRAGKNFSLLKEKNRTGFQIGSIFMLLISGRVMRGWHQGGVNWTNLPDISKWLEQAGSDHVKSIQLFSGLLVIILSLASLFIVGSNTKFVLVVGFSSLMSGLLVILHLIKHQDSMFAPSSYSATLLVQTIYALVGTVTLGTSVALPWFTTSWIYNASSNSIFHISTSNPNELRHKSLLLELRSALFVIGWTYIVSWCLLQLVLQQPINSMPILLLLVQVLASMIYSFYSGLHHKQWVEVAAIYYLGIAGHFALGNSNSLATIDVAGAFIGISSHSTVLSGVLMFMITYASPMLVILSMVMYISVKDSSHLSFSLNLESGQILLRMLGFPCLVPLGLNSILLTAYTFILLLMRNHLFVWSVFSPKYLYVCASTICVYTGVFVVAATTIYTHLVLLLQKRMRISAHAANHKHF